MKIRSALEKSYLFYELEDMKRWYCKNNYSRQLFLKQSIVDISQGSGYESSSDYPRVLKSPRFWICLYFWMCQNFGYTRVLNMALVLNMRRFWIYQNSEYIKVTQGSEYAWIIPEYAWICLIMSEYVWICQNMSEYA